jgi:uridine kinase
MGKVNTKRARDEETIAPAVDVVYRRTLRLVASIAAQQAFPDRAMYGGHPIDGSYLFSFATGAAPTAAEANLLEGALLALIDADVPIVRKTVPFGEALAYFEAHDMGASASLLRTRVKAEVDVLAVDGVTRLALFPVLPSTAGLARPRPFVRPVAEGLLIVYNASADGSFLPSPTLLASFADHRAWNRVHGSHSLGHLNALKGVGREVVDFNLHAEFRQEAKLAAIAEQIRARNEAAASPEHTVGVICIAGPTSSGKTTFATKLAMYLSNFGYHAVALSVDHYYLPLDRQPKYALRHDRADVDYDHIEAMDLPLVNAHVNALLAGAEVLTPVYNMKTGYRDEPGKAFKLPPTGKSILVLEGIHSLNPAYVSMVAADRLFKIYISPLSALQLDEANTLRTTDHRLLRRMCRDYLFRGYPASRTLAVWDKVRLGEDACIFPYQNHVDFVMNSAMEYELRVRPAARACLRVR